MKNSLAITVIMVFTLIVGCNSSLEELTLSTPTIQCGMCQKTIEVGLSKVAGVSQPQVDLKTKKTTLSYNPEKTNVKSLEKVISELGYQANDLKANKSAYANLPECCKIGGMDKM